MSVVQWLHLVQRSNDWEVKCLDIMSAIQITSVLSVVWQSFLSIYLLCSETMLYAVEGQGWSDSLTGQALHHQETRRLSAFT